MTDKRILIECVDTTRIPEHLNKEFDRGVKAVFYTKNYLKITEIDLDDGTVRDIPITEKGKLIFRRKKDEDVFDYEIENPKE